MMISCKNSISTFIARLKKKTSTLHSENHFFCKKNKCFFPPKVPVVQWFCWLLRFCKINSVFFFFTPSSYHQQEWYFHLIKSNYDDSEWGEQRRKLGGVMINMIYSDLLSFIANSAGRRGVSSPPHKLVSIYYWKKVNGWKILTGKWKRERALMCINQNEAKLTVDGGFPVWFRIKRERKKKVFRFEEGFSLGQWSGDEK